MNQFKLIIIILLSCVETQAQRLDAIKAHYTKKEVYIIMRDGVKLFTAIYSPRDTTIKYPILMVKTPYGINPYGENNFPEAIGPSQYLEEEDYIFVHQDARGMFRSEGYMDQMTPHLTKKPDSTCTDNSSDTYDTVEWLLHHTNNNGRVGLWGISYRGFYASSGIIDAHPAIVCSSPQAPIADWFIGDDIHHNGAFSLLETFDFFEIVGQYHNEPFTNWPPNFGFPVTDCYNFFLSLGKLSEVNSAYFENKVPVWDTLIAHPDYDEYWQRRNICNHLKGIRPAVLVTGGLFDHENLYGSLQTYHAIKNNSSNDTRLVLGPWKHGGWARTTGETFGILDFGGSTSDFYQREIEAPFFNYYLKQKGSLDTISSVFVFLTGSNVWKHYNHWPPEGVKQGVFFLNGYYSLTHSIPSDSGLVFDEYTSDPFHPVPYTQVFHPARLYYNPEYMAEDQRFASSRPDVLTYQTDILYDTTIFTGTVEATLYVSSTSDDFDLVVKLIDVYPDRIQPDSYRNPETEMAGFQQLVRLEILRVKYRRDYSAPEPFIPGTIEKISIPLNDICNAFLPGHRIMVQIQSSLFPLYDRNPQKFMNIYEAEHDDFRKADIRIYRSKDYPSHISFGQIID
jgi:putative CocE/NonD family hydrolase